MGPMIADVGTTVVASVTLVAAATAAVIAMRKAPGESAALLTEASMKLVDELRREVERANARLAELEVMHNEVRRLTREVERLKDENSRLHNENGRLRERLNLLEDRRG